MFDTLLGLEMGGDDCSNRVRPDCTIVFSGLGGSERSWMTGTFMLDFRCGLRMASSLASLIPDSVLLGEPAPVDPRAAFAANFCVSNLTFSEGVTARLCKCPLGPGLVSAQLPS